MGSGSDTWGGAVGGVERVGQWIRYLGWGSGWGREGGAVDQILGVGQWVG